MRQNESQAALESSPPLPVCPDFPGRHDHEYFTDWWGGIGRMLFEEWMTQQKAYDLANGRGQFGPKGSSDNAQNVQ